MGRNGLALALLCASFSGAHASVGCVNLCGINDKRDRGRCEYGPTPECQCNDPFAGRAADCSERVCPTGIAWFDRPTAKDVAHTTVVECSGRGQCDRAKGSCRCDNDFEGPACERGRCPVTSAGTCAGHGRCVSLRRAGLLHRPEPAEYDEWDADRIQGCVCDGDWDGFDCNERKCPSGGDPLVVGGAEVQAITSSLTYEPEVQTITVAGSATSGGTGPANADVDEVQTMIIAGSAQLPTGSFTITLDCRPASGSSACKLWPDSRRVLQTTAVVALDPTYPPTTADAIQVALSALFMIGPGQVTVTGAFDVPLPNSRAYYFQVTFSGAAVAGALPLLDITGIGGISVPDPLQGGWSPTTVRDAAGSEVSGTLRLSWDFATSNAAARTDLLAAACSDLEDGATLTVPGSVPQTPSFSVDTTDAAIAAEIRSLVFQAYEPTAPAGAITVTRRPAGGPSLILAVTFAAGVRARGDVSPLVVVGTGTAVSFTHPALTGAAASPPAVVETVKGNFLAGAVNVRVRYRTDAAANSALTPGLGPLSWCASPAGWTTALNAEQSRYGYGMVTVSRERAPEVGVGPGLTSVWMGGYTWRVTFRAAAEDVQPIDLDASALTDKSGGGGAGSLANVEVAKGGRGVQASEVQLIDCTCTLCTTPASQYIRLAFGDQVTAPIPYDATGAAVRAALAALTGVQDVLVSRHGQGGTAPAPLCSATGVTTAITFAWNAGVMPPLRIAGAPVTDGNTLPSGSHTLSLHVGRGWGQHGARAKRGTRKLMPCSNRGRCNVNTGACTCYPGWAPSDGGHAPEAHPRSAFTPGLDVPDALDNCGYPTAGSLDSITVCPTSSNTLVCSGHGACRGAPEYTCECVEGFGGPGCDQRLCPTAPGWFRQPLPSDPADTGAVSPGPEEVPPAFTVASAHVASTCAYAGRCGFTSGDCLCRSGWGGAGCGLIVCPGQNIMPGAMANETCASQAPCVSLSVAQSKFYLDTSTASLLGPGTTDPSGADAHIYTTPWDAQGLVRGCVCEALPPLYLGPFALNSVAHTGYNCGELTCPGGPDPHDVRAFDDPDSWWEVQSLTCTLNATVAPRGRVTFAWRNATSSTGIRIDAFVFDKDRPGDPTVQDRATLEQALNRLRGAVPLSISVTTTSAKAARPVFCDPSGETTVQVTFVGQHGDQPLLVVRPDVQALLGTTTGLEPLTAVEVRPGLGAQPGTKYLECNKRGVCNRKTGKCACMPGFESSDGYGNRGQLGDCGFYTTAVQPESGEDAT